MRKELLLSLFIDKKTEALNHPEVTQLIGGGGRTRTQVRVSSKYLLLLKNSSVGHKHVVETQGTRSPVDTQSTRSI